jgi:hypothetical protein
MHALRENSSATAEVPNLTSKVIRNSGKDFCHIPEEKLNEEKLKKKPLAKKTAGPRAK